MQDVKDGQTNRGIQGRACCYSGTWKLQRTGHPEEEVVLCEECKSKSSHVLSGPSGTAPLKHGKAEQSHLSRCREESPRKLRPGPELHVTEKDFHASLALSEQWGRIRKAQPEWI